MTNIAAMIEIRNRYRKQVVGEIKVIDLKEG
jgi:hypothetical protein